ncbi:hypothetical protein ACFLVO_04015 [Chloroflexota bacterium]
MSSIDQAITTLMSSSGLERNQAKLAVYYAIATWTLPQLSMFPILRFCGPPGTGKSSAMAVITPWCRAPHSVSGKLITPPVLRDELKEAYMGTAIIEEADEASNAKDCEQLFAARCSPSTGSITIKERTGDIWQQVSAELYGATIIHYRRPVIDQATASRTITIETRFRDTKYGPPVIRGELRDIFKGLGEVLHPSDMADIGTGRVHDIWAPILAVAKLVKDEDWLKWAGMEMEREIENLRDGHAYEITGQILAQVVRALTDEKTNRILCHQLKVQDDIIIPLRRNEGLYLNGWQASRQLKELGFTLERIGGQNKFTPTLESLKRAAEKIGYEDSALK